MSNIENNYSAFTVSLAQEKEIESKLQGARAFIGKGVLSQVLTRISNIGAMETELQQAQKDSVRAFANVQREIARTPGAYRLAAITGFIDHWGTASFSYHVYVRIGGTEGQTFPINFYSNHLALKLREGLSEPQLVIMDYDVPPTIQISPQDQILLITQPVVTTDLWGTHDGRHGDQINKLYSYWKPTISGDFLLPPSFRDIPWVANQEKAVQIADSGRRQEEPSLPRLEPEDTFASHTLSYDYLLELNNREPQNYLHLP